MDVNKLKGLMKEKGHTQKDLAGFLNISEVSVNLKLQRKRKFTDTEISKILEIYKIGLKVLFDCSVSQ